jgi:hypothetical protein
MNDPWTTLVESLSGSLCKAPAWWPARRVHRLVDDLPGKPIPAKAQPVRRPLQARQPISR